MNKGPYTKIESTNTQFYAIITIGASAIIFCLIASTLYHTYNCLDKHYNELMLRIDLMGIGVMIFTLLVTGVYCGYHAFPTIRDDVSFSMICIFALNFVL